jgi:hypothetical protein
MKCAVVIPLFNGSRWIRDALESVFAQTRLPWEVIVVDDGSVDESPEMARAFPEVILLRNPKKGTLSARNWGFKHTSAPLLAFLDQDDLWHHDHLKRLQDALGEREDAPAAVSIIKSFTDSSVPVLGADRGGLDTLDPWASYPLGSPIRTPSGVMVRRQALVDVGGWHEAFAGVGDYHLWLRLTVTSPLVLVQAETAGRRIHATSQFRKILDSDPVGRLERRAMAAEDAGRRRMDVLKTEEERLALKRRMGLSPRVVALAKALLEGDWSGLRDAALRIEETVKEEPEDLARTLFRFLAYSLCSMSDPTRHPGRIFWFLQNHWPEEAVKSGAALQKYVSLRGRLAGRPIQAG